MIRWVAGGIGWSLAAFTIVGSTVLLLALWYWFIQPSWEARALYDAANEARSRPFVESADVLSAGSTATSCPCA